uniref:Uncharacterized protein n=1 Tax=uncultured prokaryote TaxID=198431 RepID=A0A0H5Q5A3_9ZZZZ|nr:hypothetical protein [uncultured prokaryote]
MRLAFKVSDVIAENIEFYSNQLGISKSAFVAVAVGQYINQLQKQDDITTALKDSLVEAAKNGLSELTAQNDDDDFTE